MQKKKLDLKSVGVEEDVSFNDGMGGKLSFKIINYIPVAAQFMLVNIYLDAYFNSAIENIEEMFISEWDYIGAENALMLAIIDGFTDILVVDEDEKVLDIDNALFMVAWNLIKYTIRNYEEFRKSLDVMVEDAKREILSRKSVGHVIDNFSDKVMSFIGSLSEVDLSEEGVKKIIDSIGDLSEQLEDSPIGGLLEESKLGIAKNSKNETT